MTISDMTRKNKIIFGEDHQDPSYSEEGLVDEIMIALEHATNGHQVYRQREEQIRSGLRRMKYEELNRLYTVIYFIIQKMK